MYGFPCSAADLYGEYSKTCQSRTAGGSRVPMKHAAPGCGRPQRGSVSDLTRSRPGVAEKRGRVHTGRILESADTPDLFPRMGVGEKVGYGFLK